MTKKTDKQILFERMNKVGGMPLNENIEEGWLQNLATGALMTAATLGNVSGAEPHDDNTNKPEKQGTENVNKEQQEVFYKLMIGIAKHNIKPNNTIEQKRVYNEIINYFSTLKKGEKPQKLSNIALNVVKNWNNKIKNTNNSTINALIKLGQNNKTAHIDNFN